jgi:hypothetical protein
VAAQLVASRVVLNYTELVKYIDVRWVPLPPQHGASSGCGRRDGFQQCSLPENILNKQPRTNDKGWSSSYGVGPGANNPSP